MLTAARLLAQAVTLVSLGLVAGARAEGASRWYTIELVVFENHHPRALESEAWPDSPGKPNLQGALELSGFLDGPGLGSQQGDGAYAFRLIDRRQYQLTSAAKRVASSFTFHPLLHIAWRQPGLSKSRARPVHITSELPNPYRPHTATPAMTPPRSEPFLATPSTSQSNAAPGAVHRGHILDKPFVDGTLRLYVARYLHVVADLVYYRPSARGNTDFKGAPGRSGSGNADDPLREDLSLGEIPAPSQFRLKEHRRMRSRELHYFDHPLFGVLMRVTPYQRPEQSPERVLDEAKAVPTDGAETAPPQANPNP